MKRDRNSYLAKKNYPAAVMRRKRQAVLTNALASPWVGRPISALNLTAAKFGIPFSSVLVMFMLALGALGIADIARGHGKLRDAKAKNAQVQKEVEQLNDEIHRLGDENQAIDKDPNVIERMAREQLGLIRRGEISADASVQH